MLDRAGVKAKFDVFPEQIIDYLALVGDSSDNIPGIEKVGPKTAAKWLNQYGTLDELIAHAREISGKVGENLRAGLATLELSRKLATIRTDSSCRVTHEQLSASAPDVAALRELYTRYELRSLLQAARCDAPRDATSTARMRSRRASGGDARRGSGRLRKPTSGGARDRCDRRGMRRARWRSAAAAVVDASSYEIITDWAQLERWIERSARGAAVRLRHRDHEPRLHEGRDRRRVVRDRARHRRLRAAEARLPRRARAARSRQGARRAEAAARGSRARQGRPSPQVRRARASNHGIQLAGMRYDTMLESYV